MISKIESSQINFIFRAGASKFADVPTTYEFADKFWRGIHGDLMEIEHFHPEIEASKRLSGKRTKSRRQGKSLSGQKERANHD